MARAAKVEFVVGTSIGIQVGGAVGLTCVVSRMLHGTISQVTEKTIQIRCAKHTCWLPKKALKKHTKYDFYTLTRARWFVTSINQQWFLDKYSESSGQSSI